jgi:site-specific DNA recombinase
VATRLVIENSPTSRGKADPILLKEVARAFRCFGALLTRKVSSFGELGAREGIDERHVRRILPLAFLAPDIVPAIVEGAPPLGLTAKKLIRETELPLNWREQRQVLGFRERGS